MIRQPSLVSIITPAHNAERFVEDTILSIIHQTYEEWELLITDDCSTDNTLHIIQSYAQKDERIKVFPLSSCVGAAEARNNSIRQARGKYIAFLDSDDVWLPEKLEKQLAFMQKNEYAFTITNFSTMTEDGEPTGKVMLMPSCLSYRSYLCNTAIGCLTVVIDCEKTGYFEMPIIKSSHDMALWLLIMRRGFKVYALPETLSKYRLVSNSNTARKWRAAKDVWKVYREIEHLNIFYSAFNFCGYAINAVLKRL